MSKHRILASWYGINRNGIEDKVPIEWLVTSHVLMNSTESLNNIKDNGMYANLLAHSNIAPQCIRCWQGNYRIEIEQSIKDFLASFDLMLDTITDEDLARIRGTLGIVYPK